MIPPQAPDNSWDHEHHIPNQDSFHHRNIASSWNGGMDMQLWHLKWVNGHPEDELSMHWTILYVICSLKLALWQLYCMSYIKWMYQHISSGVTSSPLGALYTQWSIRAHPKLLVQLHNLSKYNFYFQTFQTALRSQLLLSANSSAVLLSDFFASFGSALVGAFVSTLASAIFSFFVSSLPDGFGSFFEVTAFASLWSSCTFLVSLLFFSSGFTSATCFAVVAFASSLSGFDFASCPKQWWV